jgi:hypothetical protein
VFARLGLAGMGTIVGAGLTRFDDWQLMRHVTAAS